MSQYQRIDISDGIGFDKSNNSVECMICHYWYFKDTGFKYQPFVCDGCHDFSMVVQNLDDKRKIKGVDYSCCVVNMSKNHATDLLNNYILINKGVL